MKPYRPLQPLATALSLVVMANVGLPLLFMDRERVLAWLGSLLVAVALTLVFFWFAARNLEAIGDGRPRFTPRQSVGWMFVPLLNVHMAHQVLTSLWRESQPRPREALRRAGDFSVRQTC